MLDENSLVVAYDYRRGEQRARFSRKESTADRRNVGLGDCIDCRKCVAVCPTGIDIRNGTQMECVHCTACIDACDAVMDKIARPRGLIRYASLNSIERGERFRWTPRLFGYTALLTALVAVLAWLVFTRADTETTLLRAPGTMFQTTPDGKLQNLYLLKVITKTGKAFPLALRLENLPGELKVMGGELVLPSGGLVQSSVLVNLTPAVIQGHNTKIVVGVYRGSTRLETVHTMFVGPR